MRISVSGVKLRQLQYFLEVAERLHFSQAAEALFITQPTLSNQIAELENQVGAPLFDRAGRAVRLTEAGTIFRAYATRALAEVEAGRKALDELQGLSRGTLRIGVSQSFVRKLLPPIMQEFASRHPGVRLYIEEMTAGQIEHGLFNGDLDLGIAFAPSILEDTILEPLIEERLLLVADPGNPIAQEAEIPMRALDGVSMALFSRTYSTRHMIDAYLAQAGATPVVMCETNSINVMLGHVHGNVVAIIPEGAIWPDTDLVARPLIDPSPVRVSALLWAKHNYRSMAARSFAQVARDHFNQILPSS